MKKYELTSEVIEYKGHTLHRIKALKDFGSVKAGQFGGLIESEKNLSQYDNAWIDGEAMVFDNAKVFDNTKVFGYAKVYGNANIFCDAIISGYAKVYGKAYVDNNAKVRECAEVYDNAEVSDNALVYGYAKVCNNAKIFGYTKVYDFAEVYGNIRIYGNATIKGDAKVHDTVDYIVFKNFWSSGRYFTWTRSNNKWSAGCFYGTGKELINKAYNDSEISGKEYERVVRYVESILADEQKDKKLK